MSLKVTGEWFFFFHLNVSSLNEKYNIAHHFLTASLENQLHPLSLLSDKRTKIKAPSYAGHSPQLLLCSFIMWSSHPPQTHIISYLLAQNIALSTAKSNSLVWDSMVQVTEKGKLNKPQGNTGEFEMGKERSLGRVNSLPSPQRHVLSSGALSLRHDLRP